MKFRTSMTTPAPHFNSQKLSKRRNLNPYCSTTAFDFWKEDQLKKGLGIWSEVMEISWCDYRTAQPEEMIAPNIGVPLNKDNVRLAAQQQTSVRRSVVGGPASASPPRRQTVATAGAIKRVSSADKDISGTSTQVSSRTSTQVSSPVSSGVREGVFRARASIAGPNMVSYQVSIRFSSYHPVVRGYRYDPSPSHRQSQHTTIDHTHSCIITHDKYSITHSGPLIAHVSKCVSRGFISHLVHFFLSNTRSIRG